ncbi:TIM-barrel domain-containing protein [Celerinatantimonas sp. MCCC 1A17872]|uniref:glycoside hydrolase family 31 protein n=1 Tax=Celerinatantimonas sp. MCCC 1A17872 TaxID=3177514 RepID=UPI0038C1AC94
MKTIKNWQLSQQQDNHIQLVCDGKHVMHLFVLEENIIRVWLTKNNEIQMPSTWSIAPNQDVPFSGRDRFDCEGFSLPDFSCQMQEDTLVIQTSCLRLSVHQPLYLNWESKDEATGQWQPLLCDRKTSAYQLGVSSHQVAHFVNREKDVRYYGLGEKAGELNRCGRRFEMRNLDAMGYSAKTTDPLYKHIPFYITRTPAGQSFGLFYDNLASCWFDLGNEKDNYHAQFSGYRAEDGELDYYFIYGPTIASVTEQYTHMTGGTAFGPKWSLGYSGSTMRYTDADNAQEQLEGFIDHCRDYQIPCDSFQLSSGYTSIGDKRYVFNWNYDKVPDPEGMSAHFHKAHMQLAANIKPCLLNDHPMYQQVKEQGLFIQDSESDEPEQSMFWDAFGSHLDFTNPATVSWWQQQVTQQLLEKGIDSTWNDNNEFEIWDSGARCYGFGKSLPIGLIRPLLPLLMMRSSYEAQQQFNPKLRPYLISRSGCPGMNRYVQTWSGDNLTHWESLRYNIKMGLGMSLSGLYNIGHDVGGFAGDKPDPELFARWVQNGVMHPRFTIHSWNDDGTVNEPWMYPEVTPIIRRAIELRYRLAPYFYNLLWRAHRYDEPMIRPTFYNYEFDEHTFAENDDFLLGSSLLVASVVEPNQRQRSVYLPADADGWYDFYTGQWYSGGQSISVAAPLETLPLLARAGSVIAQSPESHRFASELENRRVLAVFPHQGCGQSQSEIFDDDGQSFAYQDGDFLELHIDMQSSLDKIELTIKTTGQFKPAYQSIELMLPAGEHRPVYINQSLYHVDDAIALSSLQQELN